MNAMTIQEASVASGINIRALKHLESNGVGRVSAFRVGILLSIYNSDWDSLEINKVPTKKEVVKAILAGAASVGPDGMVTVEINTVVTLLKAEGFPTSELEELLYDKKETPYCVNSKGA